MKICGRKGGATAAARLSFVHGGFAVVEKDRLPIGMIQRTGRMIPKQRKSAESQAKTQMFHGK